MNSKRLDEEIHRVQLKKYLSKDELTLPESERERLLLERMLVDKGALSEMDLPLNRDVLQDSTSKTIPKDLQIVGLVAAVLLTAILVENGGSIDAAFWLFLKSLPACALGLLIYKATIKHEFKRPASWPEWILMYAIGILIGGPLVALGEFLFGKLFP